MKVPLPTLFAHNTPLVHPLPVQQSQRSRNVESYDEEGQNTKTGLNRMVYPAFLDLEEDILNEADRAF